MTEKLRILFLDFDGVVNTPIWNEEERCFTSNMPHHNAVNNKNAVALISRFCKQFGFKIVVTSDWRLNDNWRQCLLNGGLDSAVEILDRTDDLWSPRETHCRSSEIQKWLNEHEVECFIIVDDDEYFIHPIHKINLVLTNPDEGFSEWDFSQCVDIFERQVKWKSRWKI